MSPTIGRIGLAACRMMCRHGQARPAIMSSSRMAAPIRARRNRPTLRRRNSSPPARLQAMASHPLARPKPSRKCNRLSPRKPYLPNNRRERCLPQNRRHKRSAKSPIGNRTKSPAEIPVSLKAGFTETSRHAGAQQIVEMHDPDRSAGFDDNQRGDLRRVDDLQRFACQLIGTDRLRRGRHHFVDRCL
jgi:hypothetical protein